MVPQSVKDINAKAQAERQRQFVELKTLSGRMGNAAVGETLGSSARPQQQGAGAEAVTTIAHVHTIDLSENPLGVNGAKMVAQVGVDESRTLSLCSHLISWECPIHKRVLQSARGLPLVFLSWPCMTLYLHAVYLQVLNPQMTPYQFLSTVVLNKCSIPEAGGMTIAHAIMNSNQAGRLVHRKRTSNYILGGGTIMSHIQVAGQLYFVGGQEFIYPIHIPLATGSPFIGTVQQLAGEQNCGSHRRDAP